MRVHGRWFSGGAGRSSGAYGEVQQEPPPMPPMGGHITASADSTPGTRRILSSACEKKFTSYDGLTCGPDTVTSRARSPRASKPESTPSVRTRLRNSRPAPITTTTAMATSATSRTGRSRWRTGPDAARRVARRLGASPNKSPVTRETASAKINTRVSRWMLSRFGIDGGARRRSG